MRYFATQRGIIQDSYYLGGCVCGGIGQQIVSLRLKLHSGNCHAAADDRRTRHHGFENPDPQPPAEPQGHYQAGGSGQVRPHVRNTSGYLHSIIPAEKPEIFGQIPSHNRDPDIPKIGQVRKYFENKIFKSNGVKGRPEFPHEQHFPWIADDAGFGVRICVQTKRQNIYVVLPVGCPLPRLGCGSRLRRPIRPAGHTRMADRVNVPLPYFSYRCRISLGQGYNSFCPPVCQNKTRLFGAILPDFIFIWATLDATGS